MSKVLLGDVARERKETCKGSKTGYPIVGLEHLVPEEITLTKWDNDSDNTFTKMFREGDILFGRRRAYLKKAAVAPFDGICSGDITVTANEITELNSRSSSGHNTFDFAVAPKTSAIKSSSGWVKITMPENSDVKVTAKISSGHFNSELPFTKNGKEYTSGNGSSTMTINVSSGDVDIYKK